MASTHEHYEKHLARLYSWSVGGIEAAITRGQTELTDMGVLNSGVRFAVDLGAGFGMHSIPLARAGCRVLAIDSSAILLNELSRHAHGAAITTVQDDVLNFPRGLASQPEIVLCMGDTLTHLPDLSAVSRLFETVAEYLRPGHRFVITFRDYTQAREGAERFIAVRSDQFRILTCVLEYAEHTVQVSDIVHESKEGGWVMRVSSYQKLRLAPAWVKAQLEKSGFAVGVGRGVNGLVYCNATRA